MVNLNTNMTVDGSRLSLGDTLSAFFEYALTSVQQNGAIDNQGIAVALKAWNGSAFFETRWCNNYFRGPNAERSGAYRVPDFVVPATTTIVSLAIELRGGQTFGFDRAGVYTKARLH